MVTRSSRPTAFAQPISFLSEFQPVRSFQALYLLSMTTPIPNPKLASEKACISMGGCDAESLQGGREVLSFAIHQLSLNGVPFGGVRGMKGLAAPVVSMDSSPII